ncbi:MAG: tetratricopeptide repeat protein [Sedimentisphaerales bacterium]|nr:tetratricopeptide repeat protein [Sedimentisphaerales bacterium]
MMALFYLNSASAAEPDNEEILLYLASAYDKLGRQENVLKTLEALHKINSKNLGVKNWLADKYYGKNQFAKAEKLYQQSLAEKQDANLQMRLAEVQTWQKKYGKAAITLEQLKKQNPNDIRTMKLLADIYTWNKKYDKAFDILSELHKKYPKDSSISMRYAMTHIGQKDFSNAANLCRQILENDKNNKEAKLWLARLLSWQKEYDSALSLYTELIDADPNQITIRREKARALGWARRYEEAIAEYKKAVEADKSIPATKFEMLSKYHFYNQFDKTAIKNYKRWLDEEPNNLEASYDLGQLYARAMQWDNAKKMYQLTLDNDSAHFRAKQALEKIDIYSKMTRLKTGFEYLEADSSGRTMDKRYWDVFASIKKPLNEKTSITIRQDNIWRSFQNYKQVYQQQFSIAMDYSQRPDFWAGANYTRSVYPKEKGLIHTFGGYFNFMPADGLTVGFAGQREQIADNSRTFLNKLYRDNYKVRIDYKPTRKLLLGSDYTFSPYSDGNRKNAYSLDVGYYLTTEPKSLKISYLYEQYSFEEENIDYFSPDSFHHNNIALEWRQFLNKDEIFWGANDTYYTLRYETIFDIHQQVGHKIYFDFHHDWNNNCSSYIEFSKIIYEHEDVYSENRLMLYTSFYF